MVSKNLSTGGAGTLQLGRGYVQVRLNGGQRHVHDAEVKLEYELCAADEHHRQPRPSNRASRRRHRHRPADAGLDETCFLRTRFLGSIS